MHHPYIFFSEDASGDRRGGNGTFATIDPVDSGSFGNVTAAKWVVELFSDNPSIRLFKSCWFAWAEAVVLAAFEQASGLSAQNVIVLSTTD